MIQIIGLLLCVYLCFKGVEILQIALSSTRQDSWHLLLGWLSLAASIGIAVLFGLWLIFAGEAMSDRFPQPPRPPTQYFPPKS